MALPVNADDYELQSACLEFAEEKLFSLMTDEERSRLNEVAFQAGRTAGVILNTLRDIATRYAV